MSFVRHNGFPVLVCMSLLAFLTSGSGRADDASVGTVDVSDQRYGIGGGITSNGKEGDLRVHLNYDQAIPLDRHGGDALNFSVFVLTPGVGMDLTPERGPGANNEVFRANAVSFFRLRARKLHPSAATRSKADDAAERLDNMAYNVEEVKERLSKETDPAKKNELRKEMQRDVEKLENEVATLRAAGYGVDQRCMSSRGTAIDGLPHTCVTPAVEQPSRAIELTGVRMGGVYSKDPDLFTKQLGAKLEFAVMSFDAATKVGQINYHLCGSATPLSTVEGRNVGRRAIESRASVCAGASGHGLAADLSVSYRTDWGRYSEVSERLGVKLSGELPAGLYVEHANDSSGQGSASRNTVGFEVTY